MLFNVTGFTVKVGQYFYTNINVGCCCAYIHVYMCSIHTMYFWGGGGRQPGRGGGGGQIPPTPPLSPTMYVEITLRVQCRCASAGNGMVSPLVKDRSCKMSPVFSLRLDNSAFTWKSKNTQVEFHYLHYYCSTSSKKIHMSVFIYLKKNSWG